MSLSVMDYHTGGISMVGLTAGPPSKNGTALNGTALNGTALNGTALNGNVIGAGCTTFSVSR